MNKEYKPRFEYFEVVFFLMFLLAFIVYSVFVKFELINIFSLILFSPILILDIYSHRNIIILNDNALIIKKIFYQFSRTTTVDLGKIKKLTLKSPFKVRGIRIDYQNGDYKTFLSNLSKADLMMLGNDIKETTSIKVYFEKYFKTERL